MPTSSVIPATDGIQAPTLRIVALSAINIVPGFDPREYFDEQHIRALARSIVAQDVLQPLLVVPDVTEGEYVLTDGERRYRAAFLAGITEVPVIVDRALSDGERLERALAANLQRVDLTFSEE